MKLLHSYLTRDWSLGWGLALICLACAAARGESDQPTATPATATETTADPSETPAPPAAPMPEGDVVEPAGQSDFDEAMRLRVTAESMADLERIIELGQSALQKGLDEGSALFARQMVAASLFQHATRLSQDLQEAGGTAAAEHLRHFAIRDLNKATTFDDDMGEIYLLLAKLHAVDSEQFPQAREAIDKAVQRFQRPEQRIELAGALVLRAALSEDKEKNLADLSKAIELHPENVQALRARGLLYMQDEKIEEALRDMEQLIKLDADNLMALQDIARLLEQKADHEQALVYINKAMELDPNSPGTHLLRAQIRLSQKQIDLALEDLDYVIRVVPNEKKPTFLLMKARVCLQQDQPDFPAEAVRKFHQLAVDSLTALLGLKPGVEEVLVLRAYGYASLDEFGPAVQDLESLTQINPEKLEYKLQLAAYLVRDSRPRKAIEVYDAVLQQDAESDRARLGRADAYLSIGEHAKAVAEYDYLLAKEPPDVLDSILNNLAWVLATSPDDQVRNGKRSVELARRACEMTEFKQAHIISTLAAGYAETQDFEQAQQWSEKAVELGKDHRDVAQLKSELESYRRQQPWREKQVVEEKRPAAPLTEAELDSLADPQREDSGQDLLAPQEGPGSAESPASPAPASPEPSVDDSPEKTPAEEPADKGEASPPGANP